MPITFLRTKKRPALHRISTGAWTKTSGVPNVEWHGVRGVATPAVRTRPIWRTCRIIDPKNAWMIRSVHDLQCGVQTGFLS